MLIAVYLDEDFINIKGIAIASLLSFQAACTSGSELDTPETDRFAAYYDSSFGKDIFNITLAEIESKIEPDSVTDDVGCESVSFISIRPEILSQAKLSWQYRLQHCPGGHVVSVNGK